MLNLLKPLVAICQLNEMIFLDWFDSNVNIFVLDAPNLHTSNKHFGKERITQKNPHRSNVHFVFLC